MRRQKRKKRNDRNILEHREVASWVVEVASWVVLCAMLFFSSLAFSVLESGHKPRPLIVSLILPYVYILLLGVGFLVMTAIASLLALSIIFIHRVLQSMSDDQLVLLGRGWSLDRLSVVLLYLIGVAGLILVLTSIYLVMPPKRTHTPTPCSYWRDRISERLRPQPYTCKWLVAFLP